MTEDQREIRRKKRVLEYAEKIGNIKTTCHRFGIARSTFYSGETDTASSAKPGSHVANATSTTGKPNEPIPASELASIRGWYQYGGAGQCRGFSRLG